MANTATAKQIELINKLKGQRSWREYNPNATDNETYAMEHEAEFRAGVYIKMGQDAWREGKFHTKVASLVIEALFACPKKTDLTAGIYEADGHLYRVYLGQSSGQMLLKAVEVDEGVTYTYLGAASRNLPADARRLTLDEVGDLGKTFDHCLCCGRRLDDPESVDRGIGPVCAQKYEVA